MQQVLFIEILYKYMLDSVIWLCFGIRKAPLPLKWM